MAVQQLLSLLLLTLTGSALWHFTPNTFSRRNFPADFIIGTASSAYQIEGAEDSRGQTTWDTFIKERPDRIMDGSNASVAADSYHRYKEDVKMLKQLGVDAYRFSISWSRILPNGKISGGINREGVQYYNSLIDDLKSNGLEPYVTLFHWDLPQSLEDQYLSFLSPQIVDDFRNYADLCFSLFGNRVKHWITLNEPWSICREGYTNGTRAPGRCSPEAMGNCSHGDSFREPYIAGHHMLLAHAAAVKLYRDKYQASQKGEIGISLVNDWFVPSSNTKADIDAAARQLDFFVGWFLDPMTQGDYPFIMRAIMGDRLPQFTVEQSDMVKGSFDFIGINYYSTYYIESVPFSTKLPYVNQDTDAHVQGSGFRNGIPIGPMGGSDWLFIHPDGLRLVLLNLKNKYNNPPIYITENGVDEVNNPKLPLQNALRDEVRIDYIKRHLEAVQMAIREGVNVKGYFAWSLLDNFEWNEGYTVRFGFYYVDFKSLQRFPKSSALWFSKFLRK